jgi:hypothetical protein
MSSFHLESFVVFLIKVSLKNVHMIQSTTVQTGDRVHSPLIKSVDAHKVRSIVDIIDILFGFQIDTMKIKWSRI